MSKLVLLPSAKLVPLELQSEFGLIPSAMIPLDSRPALHYIAEYYQKQGLDFLVAVNEKAEEVYRYCDDHSEIMAQVVDVGQTDSLGETILRSLDSLDELPEYLVINFADTCIGDKLVNGNVVCYLEQEDVYRWTTFHLDESGAIVDIHDKGLEKKNVTGSLCVFVGIFGFDNVPLFITALRDALEDPNDTELDPYYKAICKYFNSFNIAQKTFQLVQDWWDFGHLDTYYATKKDICVNFRYYNQVSMDAHRGIIHKTSTDIRKLSDEIKWYLKLPIGLQYMAPRIFDYNLSFKDTFVDLEFYGYPALSDVYLYGNFDVGVWNQIFEAIDHIIDDMGAYRLELKDKTDLNAAMKAMYEEKTFSRLEGILKDDRFASFCTDEILINGKSVFGLNKVINLLPEIIERMQLYKYSSFSIIHGDLCLSNILYDRRNRIVRVIDPRGGFGSYDIYGDPRYDIAKLSHSIEGDYDFLVNGMFDLSWEENNLCFNVHIQDKHRTIKTLFRKLLLEKWEVDYNQIKLIESLLFLSMVPLHEDRLRSQYAFLSRGLEIFSTVAQ